MEFYFNLSSTQDKCFDPFSQQPPPIAAWSLYYAITTNVNRGADKLPVQMMYRPIFICWGGTARFISFPEDVNSATSELLPLEWVTDLRFSLPWVTQPIPSNSLWHPVETDGPNGYSWSDSVTVLTAREATAFLCRKIFHVKFSWYFSSTSWSITFEGHLYVLWEGLNVIRMFVFPQHYKG